MRQWRIGALGRIAAGEDAGRFVEVLDDSAHSGGFLILTYDTADRSGSAYDSWVESIVDVDLYFHEGRWDIEWLEPGDFGTDRADARGCEPGDTVAVDRPAT